MGKSHSERAGIAKSQMDLRFADSVISEYFKQTIPETIPLTGFNEKLKQHQEISEIIGKMDTEKRQIEQELKLCLRARLLKMNSTECHGKQCKVTV